MKLLFLLLAISAWSVIQKPDIWKVSAIHPQLSRYHNSVEIKRGDSTMIVQFDFPPNAGRFPAKDDKVELVNNRKTLKDGPLLFDILNIIKPTK